MKNLITGLAPLCLLATSAKADIDGQNGVGDSYGAAVAVQNTPTSFGDNVSELNAAFASLTGSGDVELLLTGNLEGNGNGIVLMLDIRAGGAVTTTLPGGFGQLGSIGGARIDDWGVDIQGGPGVTPTPGGGSVVDPLFNPDVALEINAFGGVDYFINVIDLTIPNNGDPDIDRFLGLNAIGGSPAMSIYARADGSVAKGHGGPITHAFNNSNVAGVTATSAAGALTAATGVELLLSAEFLEPGGVNAIDGSSLPGRVDAFCCGGFPPPDGGNTSNVGALQRMDTLTFDAGFEADHYLSLMHGFEDALDPHLRFYAASAHYADLTDGASGRAGALGIQLAPRGLPQVLRGTTADFDISGTADGHDFLIWQRNLGATGQNRLAGDATGEGAVGAEDLDVWKSAYGFDVATATFGANYFAPQTTGVDYTNVLLGPVLPGMSQGELIDKLYAFGPGGATDNSGTGAITRELEFVLPPIAGTNNAASHRNMENIVDLQMAINNSNTAGVTAAGPFEVPTTGNPHEVITGIEFSIPLSEIGHPSGSIKLIAFIGGTFHDSISNQVSGNGILTGNLGSLMPHFEFEFPGDQFVTIPAASEIAASPAQSAVPEPFALVSASLWLVVAAGFRLNRRARRLST